MEKVKYYSVVYPDTRIPVAMFNQDVWPYDWVKAWVYDNYRTCEIEEYELIIKN